MRADPCVDDILLKERIEHFDLFCFVARSYIINITVLNVNKSQQVISTGALFCLSDAAGNTVDKKQVVFVCDMFQTMS